MASHVWDKPLTAVEGEVVAITTTPSYLLFKPGFDGVQLYSASAFYTALSPALHHVVYYNGTTYTSYTTEALDRVSTTHVPLDGMTTAHSLYLGFSDRVQGIYINIGTGVNAVNTTLDVDYSSTAVAPGVSLAWTNVAGDSDGTDSTGTLAVDGVYKWTLPTASAWKRTYLGTDQIKLYTKCYWIRITPDATLSATVDLVDIIPVYKNDLYGYHEAATTYVFQIDSTMNSGIVFDGSASQNVNVTWLRHG